GSGMARMQGLAGHALCQSARLCRTSRHRDQVFLVTRGGESDMVAAAMPSTRPALAVLGVLLLAAAPGVAKVVHTRPHLTKPNSGMQIRVGPIPVPAGKESTECTYFKLAHKRDLAVNRVKIKVLGGSHHVHIYRPTDRTRDEPDRRETCNMA